MFQTGSRVVWNAEVACTVTSAERNGRYWVHTESSGHDWLAWSEDLVALA